MTTEIYAVEQSLGTFMTGVRFRVYEKRGEVTFLKDDCYVLLEGKYEYDDPDLAGICEQKYNEAVGAP